MLYFLAPLAGWVASGVLKFIINWLRFGDEARNLAGNGGFPSTHTATVSSVVFLIAFGEGLFSPAFGLGVGMLMIVVIDATGLRIAVGQQARVINELRKDVSKDETAEAPPLRERMGHSRIEILGGLVVGLAVAGVLYGLFNWG